MTLAELFPDEDYRFTLRFGRGEPAAFFAATVHHANLLAQRRHWLRAEPDKYAALMPEGVPLLEDVVALAREWNGFNPDNAAMPWNTCLALGQFWEADFLMLTRSAQGELRLCGGCLCFPSSWRLIDKIGKPIEFIHHPVPGLNAGIGSGINRFLAGLKPGQASLRTNWGLSAVSEMNQHPDHHLPRLDGNVHEDEVWLRVEHQALVALPKSGGVLFGIRIANHRLAEVKKDKEVALRLSRALRTMAEEMAQYKNLSAVREKVADWLVK